MSIATTLKSPCQNVNKQCQKLLSNTTICIMRKTTTNFSPTELKNLSVYYDQPQPNSTCNALSFSRANCRSCCQPPKLQLTYTYSIKAYCGYSLQTHVHALTISRTLELSANYSVYIITQIAIVLFLFKVHL